MEETKRNNGQNLGIAALITAIVTFVLAVIPCVGLIAIIPGIIAIVLASVGLSQSARSDAPRGVLVAGLVIGIVASLISVSQVFVAGKIAKSAGNWPKNIENIITDIQDNVVRDLQDNNIDIRVESNGDTIHIKASSDKKDREKALDELEGTNPEKNDTVPEKEQK